MLNQPVPADSKRRRVLILKLGYTETLDHDPGGIVSLGDVLRSTVMLHAFPPTDYHVTWVVDARAAPLLKGNPYIARLLTINAFTPHQLMTERYDIVVNLEKDIGVCAVADRIPAWRRYGFRYDPESATACAYDHADVAVSMSEDIAYKRSQAKSWSEILYNMLGLKYAGQGYLLGYQPRSTVIHDIGFNHLIGAKYPLKRWPEAHWQQLHQALAENFSVSWQQGENNIEDYIEWLNSCRLIITNDSLGLHIALALGKPVVALFGPTIATEINGPNIVKLKPAVDWPCIPCLEKRCHQAVLCMNYIPVASVQAAVEQLLASATLP